jgi:hypothetical protein
MQPAKGRHGQLPQAKELRRLKAELKRVTKPLPGHAN